MLLFRRYLPAVYDFVGRLVLEGHDANEATRDTFVQAQRQLPSLREPEEFRSWLFSIAYERAARRLRSEGRREEAIAEAAAALTDDVDRAVWTSVATFEPSTRAALDLHVRHGFDTITIATVLGVDPEHASEFITRVRQEMVAALPALDDPFRAYAELGEVEPPSDLEERLAAELEGRGTGEERPSPLRRAVVALAILSITGLVAAYAAPRLAPDRTRLDAAGAAASEQEGDVVAEGGPDTRSASEPDTAVTTDDGSADDDVPAEDGTTATGSDGSADGGTATSAGDGSDAFTGEDDDVYPEDEHEDVGSPPRVTDPGEPGAPTVRITSPESGHVVVARDLGGGNWAAQVSAVAEGSDPDGQRIEGRWYSNRQPQELSRTARATFWLALPDGCPGESLVHTVTVEVTDPDGHVARDSIDIEVRCP